jgi:hypothetical protein
LRVFFTLKSHKWEESNPSTFTSHNKGAAFPLGSKEPGLHAEDRMTNQLVSVVSLYRTCGVSRQTIYNWIAKGYLKPRGFGRPCGRVGRSGALYALEDAITLAKERNLYTEHTPISDNQDTVLGD